jgi:hypothetical protein
VLDVKLFLPNIVGDVLRLSGNVTRRFREAGDGCVELEIVATRQDGELSCSGSAVVALPERPRDGTGATGSEAQRGPS